MNKKALGNVLLVLTAFIWGMAFVAQKQGMELIGPFTFNGIRFIISALVLVPVTIISLKASKRSLLKGRENTSQRQTDTHQGQSDTHSDESFTAEHPAGKKKDILLGGILCGFALFAGSSFQQIGLVYTTAGKGGFITAFYIVLVPVLGIVIGKKIRPILWLCVVLAVVGLYLICIKGDFSINRGDLLVLACAFCFAAHILVIDHFTPKVNGILLSCIQFAVVGLISIPCMAIFETVKADDILACWLPLCYAAIMSGGVGYTLQIIAQKYTEPTVASLLMSLESVFAVLGGWMILNEVLSVKEFTGCAVMFVAIILSQLPSGKKQPRLKDQ